MASAIPSNMAEVKSAPRRKMVSCSAATKQLARLSAGTEPLGEHVENQTAAAAAGRGVHQEAGADGGVDGYRNGRHLRRQPADFGAQ